MLGRRGILLGVKDGWLGAYVIGLDHQHHCSVKKGLTLWERLESNLVPFESDNINVVLGSSR